MATVEKGSSALLRSLLRSSSGIITTFRCSLLRASHLSLFEQSLFAVILGISLPVFALASDIPALDQVRNSFHSKKGFEVRFEQQVAQSTFKEKNAKASGVVKFSRPSLLEWLYEKPSRRLIRYDGKELVIEEGKEKQVVHETGKLNLQESFSFLWGESNLTLYKLESIDKKSFRIRPRDLKTAPFQFIEVLVDGGHVSEARIHNNLEGESRIQFTGWKLF